MTDITRQLARLIVESSFDAITSNARREVKRSLLNWMAGALGGCNNEAVDVALTAVRDFAGPPQATVLGRGTRTDIMHAALINAISSNILDFDDAHAHMVLHPVAPVASALLALAEYRPVSGAQLLHALVLGVEVECRLYDPGVAEYPFAWSPSVTGVFGAAAGAGRLLGLDAERMGWALGIAATQASGVRETGGTMSKSFSPAHSGRCGLSAALFAASGFTGSQTAIEGPRGFIEAYGAPKNTAALVEGWGERWHIELNTYKPFPCGIVSHAAIDACLQLQRSQGLRAEQIAGLTLRVHPYALSVTGRRSPTSDLEAKLSVYHSAACAIVFGSVGVKQFTAECRHDPEVVSLRDRIEGVVDERFATDEAHATVRLHDGRVFEQHVAHAVGSIERPLSDRDLEAKLRSLAEPVLTATAIDDLTTMLWSLETLRDAGAVARAAAPAAA